MNKKSNDQCFDVKYELLLISTKEKNMKPRIFVSSTFYDLKYIREELMRFILEKNYEPILFENGNIGYTPNKALDASCYEAMKNSDMAILIIGGKYGSPASSETDNNEFDEYISVTRNEFRSASESKIPIYTFVESKVFIEYELYESNIKDSEAVLNIKFNNADNINIFKFINEIKTLGLPMFQFASINDIEHILSEQWADLMKKYLTILREKNETETLQSILEQLNSTVKLLNDKVTLVGDEVYKDAPDRFDKKLSALTLSNCIKDNIQVFENKSCNKQDNLKNLLDGLTNALVNAPGKDNISFSEFSDLIRNSLKHKNISIAFMNFDLVNSGELFAKIKSDPDLYNDVLALLMDNYEKVVRI